MTKKQKIGLFLLIFPIPTLVISLSLYAISSFVLASLGGGSGLMVVGNLISIVLGLVGIICMLGIIVGMPVGFVLMLLKDKQSDSSVKVEAEHEHKEDEVASEMHTPEAMTTESDMTEPEMHEHE